MWSLPGAFSRETEAPKGPNSTYQRTPDSAKNGELNIFCLVLTRCAGFPSTDLVVRSGDYALVTAFFVCASRKLLRKDRGAAVCSAYVPFLAKGNLP